MVHEQDQVGGHAHAGEEHLGCVLVAGELFHFFLVLDVHIEVGNRGRAVGAVGLEPDHDPVEFFGQGRVVEHPRVAPCESLGCEL